MLVEPKSYRVDISAGKLIGAAGDYQKKLRDLKGLYLDEAAFEKTAAEYGDEIVYEVTDQHPTPTPYNLDANERFYGDLIFGVTRMSAGKIGDEFFMTRGHIHACANRPETYYGEAGEGLMLMESPEGETRIIEIKPKVICYVPPFWVHRSINIGCDDLVMSFCYPSDSGQDYGIIEKSGGMKSRIMATKEGWEEVPNSNYIERTEAEIKAVYDAAI